MTIFKRFFTLTASICLLVLLAACSQGGMDNLSGDQNTKAYENLVSSGNIRVIESIAQLDAEREAVNNMTFEELVDYENANGYKSFGRIAEEIYYSVDPDDFTSQEEIFAFVEANSEYLTIVEDEEGDLYLEPVCWDNSYRYLINEDKVLIAEGNIYKAIGDGMVAAKNVTDIASITDLSEVEFMEREYQSNLFVGEEVLDQTDDYPVTRAALPQNCGKDEVKRVTHDRERVKLRIIAETDSFGSAWKVFKVTLRVKPYKRTMGVWFIAERYISYRHYVNLYYWGNTRNFEESETNLLSRNKEYTYKGKSYEDASAHTNPTIYFYGYNCWATSTKVNNKRATLQCGTY